MYVPTDYKLGYEGARAVSPELASKYIEHTQLGDPAGRRDGCRSGGAWFK